MRLFIVAGLISCIFLGCSGASETTPVPDAGSDDPNDGFTDAEIVEMRKLSPLPALPPDPTNQYSGDPAAAALGQMLFFDKSYSGALTVGDDGSNGGLGSAGETGRVSCQSCHAGGELDDQRSTPNNVSLGADYGSRNALGIVNSAFYKWTEEHAPSSRPHALGQIQDGI
jgi:cytochrome c peroxidase